MLDINIEEFEEITLAIERFENEQFGADLIECGTHYAHDMIDDEYPPSV